MPVCAVTGCGNGDFGLSRWKSQECQTHVGYHQGVGRCICSPPYDLIPFPTELRDPNGRKEWIKLINRVDKKTGKNWTPKRYSRVCSRHFPDGRPSAAWPNPVRNLGYDLVKSPRAARKLPTRHIPVSPVASVDIDDSVQCMETSSPEAEHNVSALTDHDYSVHQEADITASDRSESCACDCCSKSKEVISQLEEECAALKLEQKKNQIRNRTSQTHTKYMTVTYKPINLISKFISNDEKVRLNTGLPNRRTLDALYEHLSKKAARMRYWAGVKKTVGSKKVRRFRQTPKKFGPKRKLCGKEEFVLVLMKLRHGLTNDLLGTIFSISTSTCSQVFNTWIRFLSKELKPLVFWPDRLTILKMLPRSLATKYPLLRCTLDCTEVFIERPRHLELQALTWSDYKKHNTAKYLVGIAPNGMISFISKGWGGRTSDKHIVNESGFLNLVDPGDVILADRGFTIASELLMRGAKLEIPPASSGWEQQTAESVHKTKKIANSRIHVERAIGRMKCFAILRNTVPITLVPVLDDIVEVCAELSNLLPPLVSK